MANTFLCDRCGQSFKTSGIHALCDPCYQESTRCSGCGRTERRCALFGNGFRCCPDCRHKRLH